MPAQPSWFHRLDEILVALRQMESIHLDRLAIEKLFGVRERRARQLMMGMSGFWVGNAFAVERVALIARLERTAAGEPFQWETNRHARVAEELDRARRYLAARRIQIPAAPDAQDRLLGDLSSDITLKRGELRIAFHGAEDLTAKLFELSQAMANDWQAFTHAVQEGPPE